MCRYIVYSCMTPGCNNEFNFTLYRMCTRAVNRRNRACPFERFISGEVQELRWGYCPGCFFPSPPPTPV